MRFEIRAGGALLFLFGLAALSGTVFALGLIAGYEMARQNQVDSSQLATTYPMPNPPAEAASPTGAPSPAIAVAAPSAPPAVSVSRSRSASAAQPPPAEEEAPDEASAPAGPEEEANTGSEQQAPVNPPLVPGAAVAPGVPSTPPARVASTELPTRRHPYNIQIDAVMDSAGAQLMAARLRRLGYSATIVPSTIAGQTWYKVKVGPYASAEEARAAQDRLRVQYNAVYGH